MRIGLCCIAKQENLYIREFVEYYKNLGVDKIFIYDNNDPNGERFELVIGDYINSDFVNVIDFRGVERAQLAAYKDCYDKHGYEYDWIAFFDIDEFMSFKTDESINIKKYLSDKRFNDFGVIHLNWEIFDDNNLLFYDGRGCLERFTKSRGAHPLVKSIVRGGLNIKWDSNGHTPTKTCRVCDNEGNEISDINNGYYEAKNTNYCYLKHFITKTISEFAILKCKRGDVYYALDDEECKKKYSSNFFFLSNDKTEEKEKIFNKIINHETTIR